MIDVLFGIAVFILAVLTLVVITQHLTPGRNDRDSGDPGGSNYDTPDSPDASPSSDGSGSSE